MGDHMISFVMPKTLKTEEEKEDASSYYARFVLSPMEKGYAITIGNALRRVLLSSIPSMAITRLKIPGKYHEYDVIDGVKEDILEIILNLKKVQLKAALEFSEPVRLTVAKKGPGQITARDIHTPTGVDVMNPSQYLATLSEDAEVHMELFAEIGKGFVPVSDMELEHDVEMIYIDGVFSPVLKVNFQQENVRVGKRTDYDKLVLEVWSKRSIKPSEALRRATDVLVKHFGVFTESLEMEQEPLDIIDHVSDDETTSEKAAEEPESEEQHKEDSGDSVLSKKIEELDLSVRSLNCLKRDKIDTIGDLVERSEADLLKIRNFGGKSMEEVIHKLKDKFDLYLKKEE